MAVPTRSTRDKRVPGALTVGQAARTVGVSPSTLRLWERAGLVQTVRSRGGYRLYSAASLSLLKRIEYLRDVRLLNVAAIKEALADGAGLDRRDPRSSSLGRTLRQLRQRRGLRIADAARDAGISASFLSAVERSQATPSAATLERLAGAYWTPVLELAAAPAQAFHQLSTTGRPVFEAHPGLEMERLSPASSGLESMLYRAAPSAHSAASGGHDGEEIIYVLGGSIEVWLDERERVVLHSGDSLWFESTRSHRWLNPSATERAALVWVCSRATA